MAIRTIGLQAGIFGSEFDLKTQPEDVLDAAVKAGYSSIEYGLDEIVDAQVFRQLLDDRGLSLAGAHVTIWAFQDIPGIVGKLNTLGCTDICNSGVLVWENFTPTDFQEGARLLNEAGSALRSEGISVHYHNHAFEFGPLEGGTRGIDIMLSSLHPDAVNLCVDIAWVAKGGEDPAAFLKQHSDRIGYLHLKDFKGDEWLPLGRGTLDISSVLRLMPSLSNLRQAVVEQDSSASPLSDVTISQNYLQEALNVHL